MNKITCIYHKNCSDGFAAALAVKMWADDYDIGCQFIPAAYGDTPPDVTNQDVYIVDYSYPLAVIEDMHKKASSLTLLDHHKSAEKELGHLDYCIFNMEKCGAVIAWEHFFPKKPLPKLFQYIQDRDLWKWEIDNSREFLACLEMVEKDFDIWEKIVNDPKKSQAMILSGSSITSYQDSMIDNAKFSAEIPMLNIAGYKVPCLNATHLMSEIGNDLAESGNYAFSATYRDTIDKRIYSLRSSKEGIDVSNIAQKFGGGGHFHAAGFSIQINPDNLA